MGMRRSMICSAKVDLELEVASDRYDVGKLRDQQKKISYVFSKEGRLDDGKECLTATTSWTELSIQVNKIHCDLEMHFFGCLFVVEFLLSMNFVRPKTRMSRDPRVRVVTSQQMN